MTQVRSFPPPIRFSTEEAHAAHDAWRFNCGPGALCAVLEMTPWELKPRLLDFERKGYTNPQLMAGILAGMGVRYRKLWQSPSGPEAPGHLWPSLGLVRIQWGGPWTNPGVPMAARYRHTHWVASHAESGLIFDVNSIDHPDRELGGWVPFQVWSDVVVPWILEACVPGNDGRWWMTHSWELQ